MKPITINPETGAPEQDLSDLKVGDTVYCIVNGKGVVRALRSGSALSSPVIVIFENGARDSYKINGSSRAGDAHQCLFHIDHHPFQPQPNPLGLRVGDPVLVRDDEVDEWEMGIFAGYVERDSGYNWFVTPPDCKLPLYWRDAKLPESTKKGACPQIQKDLKEFREAAKKAMETIVKTLEVFSKLCQKED